MEELGNLATVLKFGMRLEESIANFYKQLIEDERFTEDKETWLEFAQESGELKEDLNKRYLDCCRSDMDMGALEPVSGIAADNYITEMEIPADATQVEILEKATEIEEKSSKFYNDIGNSIDFLSTEEMKRIAKEKGERKSKLEELLCKY